jgi:glucose-1-phosphate thymidylyltransferase
MKGVILAGGFGTRLHPLTKVTNKHLLPVYNKPMICYPIETLLNLGITEIMVVTGIEFAGDFLRLLGHGEKFIEDLNKWTGKNYPPVEFHYAVQKGAGGIADALRLAELFVGRDTVAVILGDNIFEDDFKNEISEHKAGARIFLKTVDDNRRFGVPVLDQETKRVTGIEEKPKEPKSPYAVTGLYIYDSRVFDVIRTLKPSARGELEITDVNNWYVEQNEMDYSIIQGFWMDAGTIETLHSASVMVKEKGRF